MDPIITSFRLPSCCHLFGLNFFIIVNSSESPISPVTLHPARFPYSAAFIIFSIDFAALVAAAVGLKANFVG